MAIPLTIIQASLLPAAPALQPDQAENPGTDEPHGAGDGGGMRIRSNFKAAGKIERSAGECKSIELRKAGSFDFPFQSICDSITGVVLEFGIQVMSFVKIRVGWLGNRHQYESCEEHSQCLIVTSHTIFPYEPMMEVA